MAKDVSDMIDADQLRRLGIRMSLFTIRERVTDIIGFAARLTEDTDVPTKQALGQRVRVLKMEVAALLNEINDLDA